MDKKEHIFQYIHKDTLSKLNKQEYKELGIDTLKISLDLKMDRANISRILNQLYNEGRLIKTSTRPVLYVDRSSLDNYLQDSFIPSIIPKDKELQDYLVNQSNPIKADSINSFHRYITNPRHSKMYEPIKKAKSAILYPNRLNILIFGERGSGRFQFAKSLANYAKEAQAIDPKSKPTIIECLNYNVTNEQSFLKLIFGEYNIKSNIYKRGVFQTTQNNIIIFNNIDNLPANALSALYNAILDKSFVPINSNKMVELKSLIVATSTSQAILDNIDIRRCFPMLIDIPNLHDRSIVEKIVIILQYLQDEATLIDKTIRISKDALSCFVMSEYKGNLAQLRSEIRQACAMGYQNYINENSFFINIEFDEISTSVLTNIFNINERINELNDTLNLFHNDYLFFSPYQQNSELLLLYDLNRAPNTEDISNVCLIDEELIKQCIADIDAASSIQLNSIRSVLLQKIYDLIYPIVKNHFICKNENLLYGLLHHISNETNRLALGQQSFTFSSLTSKIARKNDYEYANEINRIIQKEYDIELSDAEIDYIATYLYLSSQWIDKKYIQLLIVSSNKDIAKNYADYINSQYFKSYTSYLTFTPEQEDNQIAQSIVDKMLTIDRGKGVIIATDSPTIAKINSLIAEQYQGEFTIITDMSVQKLVSIAEKIESLGVTIQSMNVFDDLKTTKSTNQNIVEPHAKNLLQDIQNKLLSESLIFLNPEKACQALFNILLNIINDLSIPYSDDLLIKFLFHTTFALERCIRKEPYTYPKARYLIKEHSKLFNVIDKNFKVINEIFAVQIPTSEIGFIIEIFLPYLNAPQ